MTKKGVEGVAVTTEIFTGPHVQGDWGVAMHEALEPKASLLHDYTNNSENVLLCNRCACVIGHDSRPFIDIHIYLFMCVTGAFTESSTK